ncbi:MAG: hypothetical protein K2H29_08570, partial [Oscillospiraceae bacterium]|nr:hypothetical protein [Oscillospiraceae bacterium]
MIMNFMRKEKGYISIFLCIVLLPMVTYATMIVDACRVQMSRVQLQTAGDLAMNAALSEYEHKLEEMYGLFATATSEDELKPAVEKYFKETIESSLDQSDYTKDYVKTLAAAMTDWAFSSSEEFDEEDLTNFLEMQLKEFEYHGIKESRVSNPKIMKSQIIDYMKYKGPVSIAENLLEKIGFLNDSTNQIEAIQKKVKYTKAVSELKNPFDAAWNKIGDYNKERENYVKKYIIDANNDQGVNVDSAARIKMGLYEKMALMAMFQNNYEKQRFQATHDTSNKEKPYTGEELVEYLYKGILSGLDDLTTDDMKSTIEKLNQIESDISENIFDIKKLESNTGGEATAYEADYGKFEFIKQEDKLLIMIESKHYEEPDGSYKPNDGNINEWKTTLEKFNSDMTNESRWAGDGTVSGLRGDVQVFYNEQIKFLPYYNELLDRKAQFEYFKGLQNRYSTIVNNEEIKKVFDEAIRRDKIGKESLTLTDVKDNNAYTSKEDVASYIYKFQKLPNNFVKKANHKDNDGKNIGGDEFHDNTKTLLGELTYYECNIPPSEEGGTDEHLVYTITAGDDKNSTIVYYTKDYSTFVKLVAKDYTPEEKDLGITGEQAERYRNIDGYLQSIKSDWESNDNYKTYITFIDSIFDKTKSNNFYQGIGNDLYGKLDNDFKDFYQSAKTLRDYTGGNKAYSSVTKNDDTLLGKMLWLRTDVTAVDQKGKQWGAYIENNVNDKTAKAEMMNDQASSTETIKGDEAQDLFEVVHKIWNGYEVKYNDETLKPEVESSDDGGLKALVADIESVKFLDIGLCENNKTYGDFLKK